MDDFASTSVVFLTSLVCCHALQQHSSYPNYIPNPPPVTAQAGSITVTTWQHLSGTCHATAYTVINATCEWLLLVNARDCGAETQFPFPHTTACTRTIVIATSKVLPNGTSVAVAEVAKAQQYIKVRI